MTSLDPALQLAPRPLVWRGVTIRAKLFAWLTVVGLVGMTLILLGTGRGHLVRLLFPAAAALMALGLFSFHPVLYLGAVWWLWFLTPFVRRLVDLQAGWDSANPVLLAPLLATGVCLWDVVRHLPKLRRRRLSPFILAFVGIAYAYPVGLWTAGTLPATYAALLWVAPIGLGFHVALHVERYEAYRRVTTRAFIGGVLVMGVYGLWQFFDPPAWDRYWMISSQMGTIGLPEPYMVRVYSTMNSPQPFAMVMVPGLLLLLTRRGSVHWAAGVPGYGAFVLSMVRTAWLSWVIGFLTFAFYIKGRAARRLIAICTAPIALMAAALLFEPVQSRLIERGGSFGELDADLSFQQRLNIFQMMLDFAATRPLGYGVGTTGASTQLNQSGEHHPRVVDSGLLDVALQLGLPGGLAYMTGVVLLLLSIVRAREGTRDDVARASRATAVGIFAAMLSLNTLAGGIGAAFWHCLGLALAAQAQPHTPDQTGTPPRLAGSLGATA